jgi:cell pole-organizing protein PopZ
MAKESTEQKMAKVANQDEASMEQILQTIRGVISGKETANQEDVLELTEVVKDDGSVVSIAGKETKKDVLQAIDETLAQNKPEASPKEEKAEATAEKVVEVPKIEPQQKEEPKVEIKKEVKDLELVASPKTEQLLSTESVVESYSALKNLINTVTKPTSDGLTTRNGTTVEDLVVESMRPYLKEWLDKNLPSIVKNLVEKEIRKLVPTED